MQIDPQTLNARDSYGLLIACVIPRPIAWLSTEDVAGVRNLAPFSFFGGVTAAPPTVMVSIGRRRGERKDSASNLLQTGEGVIHIPHRILAKEMVHSSAEVDASVDEFDLTGLTVLPSTCVKPARIAEAAIAMEVRVSQHLEIGSGPVDTFFLEIVQFHIADELVRDGLPDAAQMEAVGRLGGAGYCSTEAVFSIPRPPTP